MMWRAVSGKPYRHGHADLRRIFKECARGAELAHVVAAARVRAAESERVICRAVACCEDRV
jgi:hypothetical protein